MSQTVHIVTITPRLGGARYSVEINGHFAFDSPKDPLPIATRILLAEHDADPSDMVEMWRVGDAYYSVRGRVGWLAGHVVEDSDKRGLRWRHYKPFASGTGAPILADQRAAGGVVADSEERAL